MSRVVFALTGLPTSEPVSAADFRSYARLDDNGDAAFIESLIQTARALIEEQTGRSLISQTWTASLETWPEPGADGRIRVRLAPYPDSISSVTVDGVALASTLYTLRGDEAVFDIDLDDIPEGDNVTDGVVITFTTSPAGRPSSTRYIAPLKTAILMLTAHLYENREPMSEAQLFAVPGLALIINQFRVVRELN